MVDSEQINEWDDDLAHEFGAYTYHLYRYGQHVSLEDWQIDNDDDGVLYDEM